MAAISDKKHRLYRIESWLHMPADTQGECDYCHSFRALWDDLDSEGCGDWQYCRECWTNRIEQLKRKIKLMREEAERTPQHLQPRPLFSGLDCLPGQQDLFPTDGTL